VVVCGCVEFGGGVCCVGGGGGRVGFVKAG